MKILIPAFLLFTTALCAQTKNDFTIIAYYSGGPDQVDSLPAEKLTHIIFSFCHLRGNKLAVDNSTDSLTIRKLVGLKKRNSNLRVILSLGGWGGCAPCSDMFSTDKGVKEFSQSVLDLNSFFGSDGIDLDWEYPAIEGYPGHRYKPADKQNFTKLVQQLRKTLGTRYEISFAAGGFQKFLEESCEWNIVMKEVDRVNLMSYDLVNGYSTVTGHHTPLYSNGSQKESTHNAIEYLTSIGVPRDKIVIGAAFYARVWENVKPNDNGLYQNGKFKRGVNYKDFPRELAGFQVFWDETSMAPYAYHPTKQLFATFDDKRSIGLKTRYVIDQRLDGIMFWELSHDTSKNGLVDVIYSTKISQ
jgi:chitinase